MPMMKRAVDTIVEAGISDRVKIMVGGAPVTQVFTDEIGAAVVDRNADYIIDTVKKTARSLCHLY